MAADARTADLASARVNPLAHVRISPAQAVALIAAASAIGRTFAGWLRASPIYFPDEYIYSEVGRSIADHGRPLVRGASPHFPALLQPLLTAPAWLFDDVGTSFRVIQTVNAIVMSLAAFARARGINRNTLLWWRYELRRRGHGDISGGLREVRVVDGERPSGVGADDGFEVKLSTGDVVYAPRDFDESALARLLAVLRR